VILSACLDRVPDPPVLKPKRDRFFAACLQAPQAAAFFSHQAPQASVPAVGNCVPVFAISAPFKMRSVDPPRATSKDRWRASDPSPPHQAV